LGENPASGVTMDYYIPEYKDSLDLKLEIIQNGNVIRTITNKPPKDFKTWAGGPPKPAVLPSKQGFNRFTWDFRKETLPAVDNVFVFGNYQGATVAPGNYTLRLQANTDKAETSVTIKPNPSIDASPAQFTERQAVLNELEKMITEIHESVNDMRSVQNQLSHYKKMLKDNQKAEELLKKGDSLSKRITSWEENLIQTQQKTFQDVINFNNKLNSEVLYLKDFIDTPIPQVTTGSKQRLQDLKKDWQTYKSERDAIINTEMEAYNAMYTTLRLPALMLKKE